MKPLLLTFAIAFALTTAACDAASTAAQAPAPAPAQETAAHAHPAAAAATAPAAPQLQADLRALWHDHVVQTREYALAVKAGDAAAADEAAQGVVDNAKALSAAVAGFYGAPAGEAMLGLLAGHWGGVKALTDAQRSGDQAGVQKAMDALIANASEIATFLAAANPNLPADAVRGLLVAHGGHHAAQTQQIMAGDMAGEAKTWQAMQAHMDVIADALAGAIAKQFPDKVS